MDAAPPHPPQVSLVSTTTTSITIKLKGRKEEASSAASSANHADSPVHGYSVHYKQEFGEWETVQVPKSALEYTVENLWCGTRYQLYVKAYNAIGTGDASESLHTRTMGSAPVVPDANQFILASASSVTLHLATWFDSGCPINYFVIEYRPLGSPDWLLVSNSLRPGGNFVVLDLMPASWYNMRVTAHNNPGSTVAEYEFSTLDTLGCE